MSDSKIGSNLVIFIVNVLISWKSTCTLVETPIWSGGVIGTNFFVNAACEDVAVDGGR